MAAPTVSAPVMVHKTASPLLRASQVPKVQPNPLSKTNPTISPIRAPAIMQTTSAIRCSGFHARGSNIVPPFTRFDGSKASATASTHTSSGLEGIGLPLSLLACLGSDMTGPTTILASAESPSAQQIESAPQKRLRPLMKGEAGYDQSIEAYRRRIQEMSALRFHLGLLFRWVAVAAGRMAQRLHT